MLWKYFRLNNIAKIDDVEAGVGKVPFSPNAAMTSLMTNDESLYVGTALDFLGKFYLFLFYILIFYQ